MISDVDAEDVSRPCSAANKLKITGQRVVDRMLVHDGPRQRKEVRGKNRELSTLGKPSALPFCEMFIV